MKVCYFIQAHKYPELVCRLVRTIKRSSPNSIVLIYLDNDRCQIDRKAFQQLSDVHLLRSKHRLIWSDFSNQVKPYLDAIDWLFANNIGFDWLTNITGQCYPTRPLASIDACLAATRYDGFIRYWDLTPMKNPWPKNIALNRYYHQYRRIPERLYRSLEKRWRTGIMKNILPLNFNSEFYQYRVGIKSKTPPFNENFAWYGGYAWFTLSKKAVQYIRDFMKKNRAVVNYYKHVIVPEESLIQTILVNSGLFNLCNDDKLYIDYTGHRDGHSRVLTRKDHDTITNGNYHFARKFDLTVDSEILDLLDKKIADEPRGTPKDGGAPLELPTLPGEKRSKSTGDATLRNTVRRVDQIPRQKRREWFKTLKWIFRFHRLDTHPIPNTKGELRLFMCIRNESARLPYLFQYYRAKGVDRFFVVDNDSNDDSRSFLLSQNDTHVFGTKASYGNSGCGSEWIRHLLDRYGLGYWCLAVDADEFLIYPHWEECSIKDLTAYLDTAGSTAFHSFLLDLYSDRPLKDTVYQRGEDPLNVCSFFDLDPDCLTRPIGNTRKRVFDVEVALSKVCLFKYAPHRWVSGGMHRVVGFDPAPIKGAALHFKFFSNFHERVVEEAEREEHWLGAVEYKGYAAKMTAEPGLTLWHPGSIQFTGSAQLIELGLMRTSDDCKKYFAGLKYGRNTDHSPR